jgi:Spy/CpxP family protein refolding chaperone
MKFKTALFLVPFTATMSLACDNKTSDVSSSASTPTTQTSAPVVTASAPASAMPSASAMASARPMGMDHRAGIAGMFFRAARAVDLKDPQKATLDKLEDALKTEDSSMKDEMKAMHAEMLAGVKAGKIDNAKVQAHYAAIDKAAQVQQDKQATALNGLHGALDATQRKAVTASLRAKQAEREAAHPMPHAMPGMDGGAADWNKRGLDRMTKDLDLDAAQQKSVAALMAKGEPMTPAAMDAKKADMKKRMDALMTAFEADTFDAKKMDMSMMPGKKMHDMMDKHVQFFAALLPILKPEQREKLAATMDGHGGPGAHGGGMGGGKPDMHGDMMGYGGMMFEDAPHGEGGE